MRLFVIILAVVGMAFASGTISGEPGGVGHALPETDDVLDTYAYDTGTSFSTIPAASSDYAVCDDYTASGSGDSIIDTYTTWAVTTAANPTALELLYIADNSGPDGAPVSQTSYPAAVSNSGHMFGSYIVWIAVMDLSSDPAVVLNGETVWLGAHRNDGSNWFAGCGTTVAGSEGYRTLAAGWDWAPFSGSLVTGDLFKIIEGIDTSLSRSTWAGIKNMF